MSKEGSNVAAKAMEGLALTFVELLVPFLQIRKVFPGVDIDGKVDQSVIKLQLPSMGWEMEIDGQVVRARHPGSGASVEDSSIVKVLEFIKEKSSK